MTSIQKVHTLAENRDRQVRCLPNPPENLANDMISSYQLAKRGHPSRLELFLQRRHPDGFTVTFSDLCGCGAPEISRNHNGYIVSTQGRILDFVMEIASGATCQNDSEIKTRIYAELEVPEYWRFDRTGQRYGDKLTGAQLADDRYRPLPIEELPDGELRGYSASLGLYVCWRAGRLDWYDPVAQDYIPSHESLLEPG